MVGNSPRFDINTALELGLNCIWLHTGFWREDMDEFAALPTFVAFTLDEVLTTVTQGTSRRDRDYVAPQKEQAEIRQWLQERALQPEGAYLAGTSLMYDVNPGLDFGLCCIWPYAPPKGQEREPSLTEVYVALSTGRVGEILSSHSKEGASADVPWRVSASGNQKSTIEATQYVTVSPLGVTVGQDQLSGESPGVAGLTEAHSSLAAQFERLHRVQS